MSRSNQLAGLITATPTATLDTINEINTSLNNDANLSTTLTNSIATKASKSGDTFTGNVAVAQGSSNNSNLKVETTGTGHAEVFLKTPNRQYNIGLLNDGSKFQLYDVNAGANRFEVDTSGNFIVNSGKVGIGCTPSHHLHIEPSGWTDHYLTLHLKHPDSTASRYATLNVRADDNKGLQLGVGSSGTSTSSFYRQSYIESYGRDLNLSTYDGGYNITLRTAPSGGSATERMRIDSSGNVGIGAASSGEILGIDKSSGNTFIRFDKSGTFKGLVGIADSSAQGSTGSVAGDMILRSQNNVILDTDGATRLLITSGGNVGIGTTSPQSLLDVNGEMRDSRGVLSGLYLQYGPTTITNGNNHGITQINGGAGIIKINSNHNTFIPFWTSGGGGVGYTVMWLDPDSGTNTSGSFSYSESGSNANTYSVSIGYGNGIFYIQATTKNSDYTVRVYRWF